MENMFTKFVALFVYFYYFIKGLAAQLWLI